MSINLFYACFKKKQIVLPKLQKERARSPGEEQTMNLHQHLRFLLPVKQCFRSVKEITFLKSLRPRDNRKTEHVGSSVPCTVLSFFFLDKGLTKYAKNNYLHKRLEEMLI